MKKIYSQECYCEETITQEHSYKYQGQLFQMNIHTNNKDIHTNNDKREIIADQIETKK